MKFFLFTSVALFVMLSFSFLPPPDKYDLSNYPTYNGNDLGVFYKGQKTVCKVWAPKAASVILRLYQAGEGGAATDSITLIKGDDGTWATSVSRDVKNQYYTFQVYQDGKWLAERPDMYAKAVGVNGRRGMIVDLSSTDPDGWNRDKRPQLKNFTDIIIYEMHIRDFSVSGNSGIQHKGKFLGVAESGTISPAGAKTGLDHLKELGITHVHLLPSFDFSSIDETRLQYNQYNWGYDPLNYNVPEGSYATDPYNGNVRIREFKQMVQTLHANGIRVILDVVYNHTSNRESGFNQFASHYFYRHRTDGSYSDATACGNETASERPMMRSFMINSVAYWATEYHLDGFRFDLMGVHDKETMNEISETLHKIDPAIFVYGEGWTAGESPLPEALRAVKKNTYQLNKIAAFSDDIRDGLHGPFNNVKATGFVSGAAGTTESVKFGIVAAIQHPQIDYGKVNYSKSPWAAEPYQTINYVSCHDDHTLFDRLKLGNLNATEAELIKMDKLANAIVLTSQGVAFLHAGAEMLRTKRGIANSYNSPDFINELDWSRKTAYKQVFDYYRSLVALRKHHPAFRMPVTKMIQEHLTFIETADPLLIAYQLTGHANGDTWKNICVLLNGSGDGKAFNLPLGNWILAGNADEINEEGIRQIKGKVTVPGITAYILYQR